jgi:hypothetical protein
VPLAYQVAAFNLLVLPDCRLPGGWKISIGGLAIPPLPVGTDLENVIHRRRNKLLEEDRSDPNFTAESDLYPALLAKEWLAAIDTFESPIRLPLQQGRLPRLVERLKLLGGHRCPPRRPPSAFAMRLHGAESVFCADKGGIDVVLKIGDLVPPLLCWREFPHSGRGSQAGGSTRSAPGVKVEVKQEPPEVKVEVPEVKVEVKDEPPSRPHAQPPTSHAPKRARMEATPTAPPPSPPPPEPWRAEFAVPLMYRRPDDGEWAGYNTAVRLSAAAAGIVVIDDDEDADGGRSRGVGTDVKGKAPL